MNILFLTSRKSSPSFRFRVLQFVPWLLNEGFKADIQEIPKNWFRRIVWLSHLKKYNVIFIQRRLLRSFELNQIRNKTDKLVFDFDDAIMYRDSSRGAQISKKRENRFKLINKIADIVIAGNKYLAEKSENKRVEIIPTVVDTDKYLSSVKNGHQNIVIGWIGTKSTLGYLYGIKHVLDVILNKYKNVTIKIVCDDFSGFDFPNAITKKWDIDEEISDLRSFDIGIMPLPLDPWTEGKCGFKLIQYMAFGLPVVCSPVGVNRKIVKDGINGFLCASNDMWIKSINRLIENADLRRQMGSAGRELVETRFSVKKWAPHITGLLKK